MQTFQYPNLLVGTDAQSQLGAYKSRLTATVWRGGELLSDETVAKMGLLAWYVGGRRVATGGTYACAAGTAAECRLEA